MVLRGGGGLTRRDCNIFVLHSWLNNWGTLLLFTNFRSFHIVLRGVNHILKPWLYHGAIIAPWLYAPLVLKKYNSSMSGPLPFFIYTNERDLCIFCVCFKMHLRVYIIILIIIWKSLCYLMHEELNPKMFHGKYMWNILKRLFFYLSRLCH